MWWLVSGFGRAKLHPGVRFCGSMHITYRALVVAAELSDRYITARFLPDKVGADCNVWERITAAG
jgi:hypothetical protein